MGRMPVAAIRKRKGLPGRTPKRRGPLIRGVSRAGGVKISFDAERLNRLRRQRIPKNVMAIIVYII